MASNLWVAGLMLLAGSAWAGPYTGQSVRMCMAEHIVGGVGALTARDEWLTRLLRQVATDLDVQIEVKPMPWKRCLAEVESGSLMAAVAASYEVERAVFGAYPMRQGLPDASRRLYSSSYVVFKRQDSPLTWDGMRFGGIARPVIGAQTGYSIVAVLRDKGVTVDDSERIAEQILRKLRLGSFDGVVMHASSGEGALRRIGDSDIVRLNPPVLHKDYFILFNKTFYRDHGRLVEAIWTRCAELRATPAFSEVPGS